MTCYTMMMMMMMIYFLYSATSKYALSALQLLKHEPIYRLFFTHTNIHTAAIAGGVQSHSHVTFTHSEVAEISILNILNALGGIQCVSRVW